MENITGTWALVKTEAVDENGRPTPVAPFGGESFIGRVVFTKEGRMSAAITDARAKIPDGENLLQLPLFFLQRLQGLWLPCL